jgi:hypothetical protein
MVAASTWGARGRGVPVLTSSSIARYVVIRAINDGVTTGDRQTRKRAHKAEMRAKWPSPRIDD